MRDAAGTIEDAEWLDEQGLSAVEAADRLSFPTPHALERWLHRHGRYDLWRRLNARTRPLADEVHPCLNDGCANTYDTASGRQLHQLVHCPRRQQAMSA